MLKSKHLVTYISNEELLGIIQMRKWKMQKHASNDSQSMCGVMNQVRRELNIS